MGARTVALVVAGVALAGGAVGAVLLGACTSSLFSKSERAEDQEEKGPCPARLPAPSPLPHVGAEHRTADYWTALAGAPDAEILTAEDIDNHRAALAAHDAAHPEADPLAPYDLLAPENEQRLAKELRERLAYMAERIVDGRYLDAEGKQLDPAAAAAFDPAPAPNAGSEVRELLADTPLRCGPRPSALYQGPAIDPKFDRNLCSTARAHEPIRVISTWPGGMLLVRTRYAMGWMAADTKLSAPLSEARTGELSAHPSRPLTRRTLYAEAFRYLDTPYGWGDAGGGRDCSRFLMDVFGAFGLELPRHSGQQAQAGSMSIEVDKATADADRLAVIDAAHERGVVLLHFPGHIMLYLGRSQEGVPMAIHAFAEYAEACAAGGDTLRTVDKIHVSDLSLGKGSARRSFLERITRITVFAATPGDKLLGAAVRRTAAPVAPAKSCADSEDVAIFVSPRRPHAGAPVRVMVAASADLGPVAIVLTDGNGTEHVPELHRLGGPPFGYWAEVPSPPVGGWAVRIGDGTRVAACERFDVHERGDRVQASGGIVWRPRLAWTTATENLWSLWVEQLFDYPLDDRTWTSLQALLGEREKNLLHGHLGQNEEAGIQLQPDCADLAYFLRAYFAWKMRLPFAYRQCNRGKSGQAPYCDRELFDSLSSVEGTTESGAFALFARDNLANGVHSGNGRTEVQSSDTDYYPIALSREAIRPGTIFADPYGHSYIIADWVPQAVGGHGILLGADAQPDGTIGRRRFWPGTFLFTPDLSEAGSGFKAFRTLVFRGGRTRAQKNGDLPGHDLTQYKGSKQDFYDSVDALINPRPLDPRAMLEVLITALHEQVKGRVLSVQNGVDYLATHSATIDMPRGHSVFETEGPWEDYSTPSRDMRLLIAIDTVLDFPDAVKRNPVRYGVTGAIDPTVEALRKDLAAALASRRFGYKRSEGTVHELSLQDVVDRAASFEAAYNPNDCPEARWGAPDGSAELARCARRAPAAQQKLMDSYRSWFKKRQRPQR